jgi:hypothetical protein
MKKIVLSVFLVTFFITCFAQVTIYKEDGSTIEGTSLKMKKDFIDYGTGTISRSDVLFLKYRGNYYCLEGKKQLAKLKKSFNPDINDKFSMAIALAHKFYKCNCNPGDSSPVYTKFSSDQEFVYLFNNEQKKIKNGAILGFIGGCVSGVLIYFIVSALVSAAV